MHEPEAKGNSVQPGTSSVLPPTRYRVTYPNQWCLDTAGYCWALLPFRHKAFGCRDSYCAAYEEGKMATPVLIHVLPKQGW